MSEPIRLLTWDLTLAFSRPSYHPSRPAPDLVKTASWAVTVAGRCAQQNTQHLASKFNPAKTSPSMFWNSINRYVEICVHDFVFVKTVKFEALLLCHLSALPLSLSVFTPISLGQTRKDSLNDGEARVDRHGHPLGLHDCSVWGENAALPQRDCLF